MDDSTDRNVEIWRVRNLIKKLTSARGAGTSMISLVMPPKDQISRVSKMLADEYGTASNIKSRVNRLSVLSAITSAQQRLKLYNKMPTNGMVIYCGTILTDDGKEKKVNINFEPFKGLGLESVSGSTDRVCVHEIYVLFITKFHTYPKPLSQTNQHLPLPLRQQVPLRSSRRTSRRRQQIRLHHHGR